MPPENLAQIDAEISTDRRSGARSVMQLTNTPGRDARMARALSQGSTRSTGTGCRSAVSASSLKNGILAGMS
jgi:hypothetical protein